MSTPCHCARERHAHAVKNGAGWVIPGVMLALLPKCPLCLAAWFSLLFGIGMSASVATALHHTFIILCVAACLFFLARHLVHQFRNPTTHL